VVIVCGKGTRKKGGAPPAGFIGEVRGVLSGLRAAGRLKGVAVEAVCMARMGPENAPCDVPALINNAAPRFIIVESGKGRITPNGGMTSNGTQGRKTVVINRLTPGLLEKAIKAVTSGEAWLGRTNPVRESAWSKAVAKTL